MRTAIPHTLERAEVRRRLSERSHEIANFIPGGMAQVDTDWPSEDTMGLNVQAMGQAVTGTVVIEDNQVVLDIRLPPSLAFFEGVVESAVKSQGQKLLADK